MTTKEVKLKGVPAVLLMFLPWLVGVVTMLGWIVKGAS